MHPAADKNHIFSYNNNNNNFNTHFKTWLLKQFIELVTQIQMERNKYIDTCTAIC